RQTHSLSPRLSQARSSAIMEPRLSGSPGVGSSSRTRALAPRNRAARLATRMRCACPGDRRAGNWPQTGATKAEIRPKEKVFVRGFSLVRRSDSLSIGKDHVLVTSHLGSNFSLRQFISLRKAFMNDIRAAN